MASNVLNLQASKMQKPFVGTVCSNCEIGYFLVPDNGQEWHLECSHCEAVLLCYVPMPHQEEFHKDPAKFKMYAGGYGSAKTSTCCAEFIRHVYETPNGTGLIGAATLPQLEQTAMNQFFEMFPEKHIRHYNKQKGYVDCINSFRVIFRPLDDEGKARSLNLSFFWIEEASEVDYDYFVQLQSRLRSHATNRHGGILSTNPDMGWVKDEFLMKSSKIIGGDVTYVQDESEINFNFSTHIARTDQNTYLPPTYYEDTAAGKPEWWINRFLKGSFENREGLVYPQLQDASIWIEPFEIPPYWERYMGYDFGLNHPTASLWGAVDPMEGILYLYDEHYESGKSVQYHSKIIHKKMDQIPAGRLMPPVADPAGQNKQLDGSGSMFDHYAEYGIYFNPAKNKIEDGILKAYTFLDLGKVRIFNTLKNFRKEAAGYKYPERSLSDNRRKDDEKPIKKDDHLMDCFRYIVQELPDDPEALMNKSYGLVMQNQYRESTLPHALRDDDTYSNSVDNWLNYY